MLTIAGGIVLAFVFIFGVGPWICAVVEGFFIFARSDREPKNKPQP